MNIIDSIKTSLLTPIHPAGIPFIALFLIFVLLFKEIEFFISNFTMLMIISKTLNYSTFQFRILSNNNDIHLIFW